jgi:hypothetical protein
MRVLQYVPLILTWLPHVIAGVAVVESVASKEQTGEAKKKLVLDYLTATAAKLGLTWGDHAVRVVDLLIEASVTILHLVGIFRHADAVEPDVREAKVDAPTVKTKADAPIRIVNPRLEEDSALEAFVERMKG